MMLMIPREAIYFARSRLTEAFICAIALSQPFPVFRTVNSSAMAAYTDVCTEPQEKIGSRGRIFFFAPLPFYFENMTSVPSLFTTGQNWFLVNMDLIFNQTEKIVALLRN